METGKAIALAGIAATAVVGVAGSAASWLTARDNRTQERAIAHDQRVYDRRADAYLAALGVVEEQARQLDAAYNTLEALHEFIRDKAPRDKARVISALDKFTERKQAMLNDADASLHARVIAFGSEPVVAQYDHLRAIVENHWLGVAGVSSQLAPPPRLGIPQLPADPLPAVTDDLALAAARSSVSFRKAQHRFELLIQNELS